MLMKEELPRDSYVTYVSATDEDVGDNARLGYSLSDSSVDEFYVDSIYAAMAGSIKTNMVSTHHISILNQCWCNVGPASQTVGQQ